MDPDHSSDFLAILLRLIHGGRKLLDRRADPLQERLSSLWHRDTPGSAVEQTNTKPLLASSNRLTECRRRNSERFCSTAKATRISDEHEGPELTKVRAGKQVIIASRSHS